LLQGIGVLQRLRLLHSLRHAVLWTAFLLPVSAAQAQVQWLFRAPKDFGQINQVITDKFPAVPHTTTTEVAAAMDRGQAPLLLDTRARPEYEVSHLAGAIWTPDIHAVRAEIAKARAMNPQRPVVLYCSVGYRSADILAQLLKAADWGYTMHIKNLRGSLFQWANEGRPVVRTLNNGEVPTQTVHPYSSKWAHLLAPALRAPL
jgi:rhodanese-related sulfurtransferase